MPFVPRQAEPRSSVARQRDYVVYARAVHVDWRPVRKAERITCLGSSHREAQPSSWNSIASTGCSWRSRRRMPARTRPSAPLDVDLYELKPLPRREPGIERDSRNLGLETCGIAIDVVTNDVPFEAPVVSTGVEREPLSGLSLTAALTTSTTGARRKRCRDSSAFGGCASKATTRPRSPTSGRASP